MKQRSHVPSSTVVLKVSSQFLCSGKDFVTVFFRHYFITIVSVSHLFDCIVTHTQIMQGSWLNAAFFLYCYKWPFLFEESYSTFKK